MSDIRLAFPGISQLADNAFRISYTADKFRDMHGNNVLPLLLYSGKGSPFLSFTISHYFKDTSKEEGLLKLLKLNHCLVCAKAFVAHQANEAVYVVSSSLRPEVYLKKVSTETVYEAVQDMTSAAEQVANFFQREHDSYFD